MSQMHTLKSVDPIQYRPDTIDEIRNRALDRLYARRDAVDALIRSLELYENTQQKRQACCIPITAERKCS
jgi:hypothetical protein